jgi:hypothetical protein
VKVDFQKELLDVQKVLATHLEKEDLEKARKYCRI